MFSADFALEGFLTGVKVFVFYGMCAGSESFLADFAFVLGGAFVGFDVHFDVVLENVAVVA